MRVKLYVLVGIVAGLAAYAWGAAEWWSVGIGLAVPALPLFLRGACIGLQMPGTHEDPRQAFSLQAMSGVEFEDYVAGVARSCGVPVIMTPLTGDWGVDIIIGRRPDRLAVQCKRLSRPVGPGAIQEVVAGAPMQGCTRTMVVSNQEFTPAAQRLAELHGCTLVGGSELTQLRSTIRRLTAPVS